MGHLYYCLITTRGRQIIQDTTSLIQSKLEPLCILIKSFLPIERKQLCCWALTVTTFCYFTYVLSFFIFSLFFLFLLYWSLWMCVFILVASSSLQLCMQNYILFTIFSTVLWGNIVTCGFRVRASYKSVQPLWVVETVN